MRLHLAFALIWIIGNPASGWAQSTPASDTVLRAAYCVGVLEGEEWYANTPEYVAGLIEAEQSSCKWFNDCSAHLKRETKKQQWLQDLRAKRERYAAYVVVRIGTRIDPTVKALIEKGEREKKHEYQSGRGQWLRYTAECVEEGGPNRIFQGAELYECLRKRDQGAANRYACVSMPDRLPF